MATPAADSDTESPPNPPPFITPPPTNPISRIAQVTQSQTPSSPPTNSAFSHPLEPDDSYIHYHDPDLVHQTPQRQQCATTVPIAPIVYSPDRARISGKDALSQSSEKEKNKRSSARNQMQKMQKRQKTVVSTSAHKNIMQFLRTASIATIADANELSIPMSRFDTVIRKANSHWRGRSRTKLCYDPFATMEAALTQSTYQPLTFQHHRLLLEEMMLLPVDSEITCAVSAQHYFLQQAQYTNIIQKSLEVRPTQPLILDRKVFFTFEITVTSNPSIEPLHLGTFSTSEVVQKCSKSGGMGLNCVVNSTGRSLLVKFHHLIDHPLDIMFWNVGNSLSRSSIIRRKLKDCNDIGRMKIMGLRYLDEYYGDAAPTLTVINHIQSFVKEGETTAVTNVVKNSEISTERLIKELDLKASNPAFVQFRNFVDEVCLKALDCLYGDFAGFTSPILSQKQITYISDMFKSTLSKHYHAVSALLNKAGKANISRFESMQGQWDRDILYQYFTICRKRNSHFFVYWALINTASSYGGTNLDLQVFFGIAITVETMLQKLNKRYPFEHIMRRTMATLSSDKGFGVCVFDNSQMIQSLKCQRGGRSSETSLTTSWLFLKPMIPTFLSLTQWPQDRVKLTYLLQNIPSPPGMAMYETINEISPDTFKGNTICSSTMDITGNRVKAWARLAMTASQIYKLQRLLKSDDRDHFKFQHEDNIHCMRLLKVNSRLRPNRSGFYQQVKKFQHNETMKWLGKATAAQVIIPPISPHDETTNSGAAKVILSLLVLYGILESTNAGVAGAGDDPNIAQLRLSRDAKDRHLLMVGDGLTQIRAKQFSDLIDETSSSYGPRHRVTVMLQQALEQVIFIPGDLHGGGFHVMQVIYNLFYGAIIQKVQSVLKWKRICGTDVSKCYQQSTSLASILATEVERSLLAEHCTVIHKNPDRRRAFKAIEHPEELAIHVAQSYEAWINERRAETTDEVFRMVLNFVTVMNLFRMFRVAVRSGDAILIEWVYVEVLPLFNVTSKKHYFEIGLKQIEDLYSRIPAKLLHLCRINRTVPLYAGEDSQGNPMANWALDGLIETVQKYYHKMNFNTGKTNGWLKHSAHVMVMSKASRIVMEEYCRLNGAENRDTKFVDHEDTNIKVGKGRKMVKSTSNPKRERESCAVSEYLFLTKMTREIPGRVYDDDDMWKTIKKCTVQLISETEKARAERMVMECQTEEEILLDQFTDSLYNNGERFASGISERSASELVDLTIEDRSVETNEDNSDFRIGERFELDPATLAEELDLNANDGEDNDLRNVEVEDDSDNIEIDGMGQVKKSSVNQIVIKQDVIAYGRMEMRKLNLETVRVRQRARRNRYKKMNAAVVSNVANHNELNDIESGFMDESLQRNMDAIISNGNDN